MDTFFPKPVRAVVVFLVLFALCASFANAQERRERRVERERYHTDHWAFDHRYSHNHYYPQYGYGISILPPGNIALSFRGAPFFFHAGVWYRRGGPGFVVARPPFGIIVPVLPPAYATVTFGGAPYYYANEVYYQQAPGGYAVVDAPPGATEAEAAAPPMQPPQPAMPPAPQQQQAGGSWYYCDSSKTYYPYVATCKEGFRQVAPTPPPAR